ncbi:MAG: hypothetical protein IT286_05815 [Proteobacteria bacterium]|nr:hypothetical protein [Pseudomonadota bacterium]
MITPYEQIFEELNKENVRFILVGGLAVVLHGHQRLTADVDLVIQLQKTNLENAIRALKKLDYRPRPPVPFEQFADQAIREAWIEEKGLMVFSLHSSKLKDVEIDLFVKEPFDFEKALQRSEKIQFDHSHAHIASIDDLIELKKKAGRPVDVEDIRVLELLKKAKK